MVTFIDVHRGAYWVEPACEVLPIAPATYHAHKARQTDVSRLPARSVRDEQLKAHIRRAWTEIRASTVLARCGGICSGKGFRWHGAPSSG